MADKFEQGKKYRYDGLEPIFDCVYSDDIGGLIRKWNDSADVHTTTWLRHDGAAWAYKEVVTEVWFANIYAADDRASYWYKSMNDLINMTTASGGIHRRVGSIKVTVEDGKAVAVELAEI